MIFKVDFSDEGLPLSLRIKKNEIYTFKEVTPEELFEVRMSEQRGVVYKKDGRLFYTPVNSNVILYHNEEFHLCGKNCSRVCVDCPRTRDLTVPYQMKFTFDKAKAVENSWRIEKYDFITEGAEGFNMNGDRDSCLVISCENYETRNKTAPKSRLAQEKLKVNLASIYFEDFDGETPADFYAWKRSTFMRPLRWYEKQEDN